MGQLLYLVTAEIKIKWWRVLHNLHVQWYGVVCETKTRTSQTKSVWLLQFETTISLNEFGSQRKFGGLL